jgi:putative transposase
MPRQARQLSESAIYHVMLRGVNRDALFLEDADLERFIELLAVVREASGCLILAYCLMPNHVHLVIQTTTEPIGTVIKRLGIRYAGWFNRKYGRVGHLFQDRFKSVPVENDEYLVTLLRYVWNNPVEAGLAEHSDAYAWSSRRFLGGRAPALDEVRLGELLSEQTLIELASERGSRSTTDPAVPLGRPRRFTDEAAVQMLLRAARLPQLSDFNALDPLRRCEVVRELRTRGVSYRQIGRITQMSESGVRWLHLAGPQADARP